MKKIGVGILGGTGFGAGELLRLLPFHAEAEVVSVVSQSSAGKGIGEAHPHLKSIYTQTFDESLDTELLSTYEKTVIFSAMPHAQSGDAIAKLYASHPSFLFIDLSGDYRIQNLDQHKTFYPNSSSNEPIRRIAQYGLTELFSNRIKEANVIANPGCLATATILALAPFGGAPISSSIALNLATGSSGAGREPKTSTHHPVRHANFFAYKPLTHQHLPEIHQSLEQIGYKKLDLSFVPHSLPVSRGILCTAYLSAVQAVSRDVIIDRVKTFYSQSPFIRICETVELENVVGSNFCDISIAVQEQNIVVHTAIDNLIKGMVGQAIQNMNVRFDLPEITGLWFGGLRPI